jgi:hypothetical protein
MEAAPRDEAIVGVVERVGQRIVGAGDQRSAVPAEHVQREDLGVDAGVGLVEPDPQESLSREADGVAEGRGGQASTASVRLASLSSSDR